MVDRALNPGSRPIEICREKGGRIMEGAQSGFILGLDPGFRNHTRSGWIELKLGHLLYLMLPSSSPFSECKNSKWKWLVDEGVAVADFW
jgi:hypothetical protein